MRSADTSIQVFQPPGLWENTFLLFKPPSLRYFIVAAQADQDNCESALLDKPAESKLFLVEMVISKYWGKSICQTNSCKPAPMGCVHLLEQWNCICNSNCNCSDCLDKYTITHRHSPGSTCFLHRPSRWAELGCDGNHHSCILQAFVGGTNLCSIAFGSLLSSVEAVLVASTRPFPKNSPPSTGQGTNVRILPAAYPNHIPELGK